jgi:hypothetical protein
MKTKMVTASSCRYQKSAANDTQTISHAKPAISIKRSKEVIP